MSDRLNRRKRSKASTVTTEDAQTKKEDSATKRRKRSEPDKVPRQRSKTKSQSVEDLKVNRLSLSNPAAMCGSIYQHRLFVDILRSKKQPLLLTSPRCG